MCKRTEKILKLDTDANKINQMNSEYPLSVPDNALYDWKGGGNEQILVPVCKIKGGGRIDPNLSWLSNFKYMGERIDDLLDSIEERGLEDYINSFQIDQEGEKIHLEYFDNLDAYFVGSDGNHRITIAKIIGMKTIKARVCRFEFQKKRVEEKHVFNWKRTKLEEKIKYLGFTATWVDRGTKDELNIFYNEKLINNFDIPTRFNFSNGDLNEAHRMLDDLEKIIEIKSLFPTILSKIILFYLSKNEKYSWMMHNQIKTLSEEGYFNK